MNKYKNMLRPVNNKRVIDQFINAPENLFKSEELIKSLRHLTGEAEIRASLRNLSKERILVEKTLKNKQKVYKISAKSNAFGKIFYGYCEYDVNNIIRSNYTNYMIKKRTFGKVYEIVAPKLEDLISDDVPPTNLSLHRVLSPP